MTQSKSSSALLAIRTPTHQRRSKSDHEQGTVHGLYYSMYY